MIFTNKKDDELIITCNCGCGNGLHWSAGSWDADGEDCYLSLVEMNWYAMQRSRIKSYFRRLWKALRGKEYYLTEMILKKAEVEEFAAFLNQLSTETAKEGES